MAKNTKQFTPTASITAWSSQCGREYEAANTALLRDKETKLKQSSFASLQGKWGDYPEPGDLLLNTLLCVYVWSEPLVDSSAHWTQQPH